MPCILGSLQGSAVSAHNHTISCSVPTVVRCFFKEERAKFVTADGTLCTTSSSTTTHTGFPTCYHQHRQHDDHHFGNGISSYGKRQSNTRGQQPSARYSAEQESGSRQYSWMLRDLGIHLGLATTAIAIYFVASRNKPVSRTLSVWKW